jgi:AcrR family transcriptional regulator
MSPRPKRELGRERSTTIAQIKAVARQQMAEYGTAGLSLRGIAREMGITAPAIYNYFPRLDDLITALIVDAFNALADAMEAAEAAEASERPYDKIMALCLAYREWAMADSTVFQLIYGNPIPGYHAPEELTIPLARRPFLGLFRWFIRAHQAGELTIPAEYQSVPPAMAEGIAAWRRETGIEIPDALLGLLMSGWARIHGAVLLELFGHLEPLVGGGGTFYRYELEAFAQRLELGGRPDGAFRASELSAAESHRGEES